MLTADRWDMVAAHLGLIGATLGRLGVGRRAADDLYDAGLDALVAAARAWDPARGASFRTFAIAGLRRRLAGALARRGERLGRERAALAGWAERRRGWDRRPPRDDGPGLAAAAAGMLARGWTRAEVRDELTRAG